jgi:dinuclear metal center YbgI/SA1388 family protein
MRALEIIKAIENFAPGSVQEEWDNSGLMIGDSDAEISSVMLSLDCTPEVIDEAIERGAGMLITHHPLIFKGLKKIGVRTVQERMIARIIKNDLVVYSVHTNIDKVPNGVSGIMADKLGLVNRSILEKEISGETGLGITGELPKEMSAEDFIVYVKERFGIGFVKHSRPIHAQIKKVALCGGSGNSLIGAAMKSGAQVYLSGDLSYHSFFCEDGFMIIDIGHYESEIGVLDLLMSVILKNFPNFAVLRSERSKNPIYYR